MARIKYNSDIEQIRGKSGNLVYRRMPNGSACISANYDFSRRTFSRGQKEHQSRFREATRYAHEAARSQPIYAEIAKKKKLTPYNVALADWFQGPEIREVEMNEGVIRIQAMDNVMVVNVQVMVLGEKGEVMEEGKAAKEKGIGDKGR